MKKIVGIFTGLALSVMLNVINVQARDQISIVGSSTVYPFTTIVAEKLGNKGYKTPIVESTGTGGGAKLFCAGVGVKHPDFTNASRALKKSEREMCAKNGVTDIIEIIVGNDGIAFANSVKGPKLNLSVQDLWKAMAEKGPKPKFWNEIRDDLPKQEIIIMAPPPTSGTRDAWVELVMDEGCPEEIKKANKKSCELFRQDGPVEIGGENDTLLVNRLVTDKNAFAIFGFSFLDLNGDKIQGAKINDVEISLDTIQSYEYPIARPLFIYAKGDHRNMIPGMNEFMEEYVSDAAVGEWGYLSSAGLVPLSEEKLAEVRSAVK